MIPLDQIATAIEEVDFLSAFWSVIAYCARYGRQPISEVTALTSTDRHQFLKALGEHMQREDKAGGSIDTYED